jgi:hypothetical protein
MAGLTIHSIDHRFSKQIMALRAASIDGDASGDAMNCAILGLSVAGARLRPENPAALPDRFRLRLTPSLTLGCHVIYRDRREIAVSFDT